MKDGLAAASNGATVTFPSTAYGYIRQRAMREDGSLHVAQFIEKPDLAKAQQLLLSGDTLWNAGISLVQARFLVEALDEHAPDILKSWKPQCEMAAAKSPAPWRRALSLFAGHVKPLPLAVRRASTMQ